MIINYANGEEFIKDNKTFLEENVYMSSFFFLDAPLLKESSKTNYALKVFSEDRQLVVIKVEPYYVLLYGDGGLVKELLIYIKENELEVNGIYCSSEIGEKYIRLAKELFNQELHLQIGMDFMNATEITEPSSPLVGSASLDDVDELFECLTNFVRDCGLNDEVKKEDIIKCIDRFRLIRKDNKIVSLASRSPESDNSIRITDVYTRPEYRGKGLARQVVNAIKNEILETGKIATLNVDQANPISNHLYESLGFRKTFSRGIYLPKQNNYKIASLSL